MNRKYENLISALAKFCEDLWLPFEDSYGMLNLAIRNSMIDENGLREDYKKAVGLGEQFNWRELANESQLFINSDLYSNEEIENFIKFLLQDYLFPEMALNGEEVEKLSVAAENILKEYSYKNEWIFSYGLFTELKKQFKELEYYNLWKLLFAKRNILQRYIDDKEREIGYLKYKM